MSQYTQDQRIRWAVTETASVGELVSASEAKQQLGVTNDLDASEIAAKIAGARAYCERRCDRTLRQAVTRVMTLSRWPDETIVLPTPPTISVTSITYQDVDGSPIVLDAGDYILIKSDTTPSFISWTKAFERPALESGNDGAISVVYVNGYATPPPDAVEACKLVLTLLYDYDQTPQLLAIYHKRADSILDGLRTETYA